MQINFNYEMTDEAFNKGADGFVNPVLEMPVLIWKFGILNQPAGARLVIRLVPGGGVEPPRDMVPRDFKSLMSTSSITQARRKRSQSRI